MDSLPVSNNATILLINYNILNPCEMMLNVPTLITIVLQLGIQTEGLSSMGVYSYIENKISAKR